MGWNGEVRCIKSFYNEGFKKDRIYKISDGRLSDVSYQFEDLIELNSTYTSQFEEVKHNKIKLLLKDETVVSIGNTKYRLYMFSGLNLLEVIKNDNLEHAIRWGEKFNTTLSDIQPILDALNIEIVEEQPKYKIDIECEYSEEELEVLKSAGIKFKKVGE